MKCVNQADEVCVNQADEVCESGEIIPSSRRRGGCAIKKMSRSDRSGADGVVAHTASFGMHSRNVACERPPRPRQVMWLRTIFLDVASTPPHGGGDYSPDSHTSSIRSQIQTAPTVESPRLGPGRRI